MNRIFVRLALLLVLSISLTLPGLAPPVSAQATVIDSNMTVPIDFIATSCNGETVIISGESQVHVHAVGAPGGHGTFFTHIQFHLSGEGPSGTRYNANETVNSIENSGLGTASTFNSVGQLNLVSQDSSDNLRVRTTIHTTVNANGEVTAASFEFTVDCNG